MTDSGAVNHGIPAVSTNIFHLQYIVGSSSEPGVFALWRERRWFPVRSWDTGGPRPLGASLVTF